MDNFDRFRLGIDEIFVTAFKVLAAKVISSQVLKLQTGPHCPIKDNHGAIGTMQTLKKSRGGHSNIKIRFSI